MKQVTVLLIGAGGYGNNYINFFKNGIIEKEEATLVGIADPFAGLSPGYEWLMQNRIPVYNTPEDFFKEHRADLSIIAAPTEYHLPYSILAMKHGSYVLCEKPLTSTVQEMDFLEQERKRLGCQLGVGFQWSFCNTMEKMKRDILSGMYGRPKTLKTFISWPRPLRYYETSSWKGRVKDSKGNYILDSILTNAAAHYLHNIFFLLGDTMETAAYPEQIEAELYRAYHIESFDTCFLKGKIAGGEFFYAASHATNVNEDPKFCYEFENGFIDFNTLKQDNLAVGYLKKGHTIVYGNPFEQREEARKLQAMINCVRNHTPVRCCVSTARPHLLACNAVFDFGRVTDFSQDTLVKVQMDHPDLARIYCKNLYEEMLDCYSTGKLPSETELCWSTKAVDICLKGYSEFRGTVFAEENRNECKQLL